MSILARLRAWLTVPVLWRTARQTSLLALAWDGFWPFTQPTMKDGTLWPHKPLILPRYQHHVIQHLAPSTALALLSVWLGLPAWLACVIGAAAFGVIPHLVGVWCTRSYPLDPRDCLSDLWSSAFVASWLPALCARDTLGLLATVLLIGSGVSLWLAGYLTYVRDWASP